MLPLAVQIMKRSARVLSLVYLIRVNRNFLLMCLLFGAAEIAAQPEVRVYYNKYEWVGVSAGYTAARWRYELGGSWHQKELIGPWSSGHPDSIINGYLAFPVFKNDVWMQSITTITGRILRTGKRATPKFGLYYGIYFRCTLEKSELTEAKWGPMDYDMATRYAAVTSESSWRLGTGLVFGARGTIEGGVFWDMNLSFLPFFYESNHYYYYDGREKKQLWSGFSYMAEDPGYFFQIGLGYKFGWRE
jgi:hypothetical protein